jgi:GDP-L-fucose synthase
MADSCVYVIENLNFSDMYNPGQKEIRNTHLNIGTGKSISIRDLANLIKEVIGFNGYFRYDTTKPDGTLLKESDVTKLNTLGWHHKVELKEGVERLVKWYLGEVVEEEVSFKS